MFPLLALLYWSVAVCFTQNIVLRDNGYEGILLAISENVPYDERIIPQIKEIFNNASFTLYEATNNRAYFKEITILVPSNWVVNATVAISELYSQANIRVDLPSPQYGEGPWVSQPGGCGEPGEFMHITPQYLLNTTTRERYGPADKVIVHEWGHLRWGVFDEYPKGPNASEHFYPSTKTELLEPSRCSMKIKGEITHKEKKLCIPPVEGCKFRPYIQGSGQKGLGSIMYYSYVNEVTQFCDNNESSPDTLHNDEAPNHQNRLCEYKSAWEVMRQSVDFFQGANPSRSDPNFNTSINFKIIKRRCEHKIVVVMDVSGSMSLNNYISKMASAVIHYLTYIAPNNSWIGIVKYSTTAERITNGLVQITGADTRLELVSKIKVTPGGSTGIGQGLLVAHQMLQENVNATESSENLQGYRIMLLTDGLENQSPYIAEIKPTLKEAGLVVDTMLLGAAADDKLQSLAKDTGGVSFSSSGSDNSTSLMNAYIEAERSRSCNYLITPTIIISRVVTVDPSSTCFDVNVDRSLGADTTFTFNWINNRNVAITIVSPKNTTKYDAISNGNSFGYKNNNSDEVGLWNVCLKSTDSSQFYITVHVESSVRGDNDPPFSLKTFIVNKNPNFGTEPVKILTTVRKGYIPVIKAQVTATVESPLATGFFKPIIIELRDDGASADMEKDDGVYSGYLLNTDSTGKHTVTVVAIGTNDTQLKYYSPNSGAPTMTEPDDIVDDQEAKLIPTDEFERYSLAGFIDVESVADPSIDRYPPSRIKDLAVIEASYEGEHVTLEWSAVGDDFDFGNASYYELWFSEDFKTLAKSYSNASKINDSDVIAGNLSQPLPPYSKERLIIRANNINKTLVYAMIAKDSSGNASPISNIVSVNFFSSELPILPTTIPPKDQVTLQYSGVPTQTSNETAIGDQQEYFDVGTAVGISVGLLAVAIVIGATTVFIVKPKCRKNQTAPV